MFKLRRKVKRYAFVIKFIKSQVEEINVDGLTWEDVCLKIPIVKKPKCMDQVSKWSSSIKLQKDG